MKRRQFLASSALLITALGVPQSLLARTPRAKTSRSIRKPAKTAAPVQQNPADKKLTIPGVSENTTSQSPDKTLPAQPATVQNDALPAASSAGTDDTANTIQYAPVEVRTPGHEAPNEYTKKLTQPISPAASEQPEKPETLDSPPLEPPANMAPVEERSLIKIIQPEPVMVKPSEYPAEPLPEPEAIQAPVETRPVAGSPAIAAEKQIPVETSPPVQPVASAEKPASAGSDSPIEPCAPVKPSNPSARPNRSTNRSKPPKKTKRKTRRPAAKTSPAAATALKN